MSAFSPVLTVKAASPYRAWAREYSGVHNQKNDCAGAPCRLHTAGNQAQEGTRVYHLGAHGGVSGSDSICHEQILGTFRQTLRVG